MDEAAEEAAAASTPTRADLVKRFGDKKSSSKQLGAEAAGSEQPA